MNPERVVDIVQRKLRETTEFPPKIGDLLRAVEAELKERGSSDVQLSAIMPCVSWYVAGFIETLSVTFGVEGADAYAKKTVKHLKGLFDGQDKDK